MIHDVVAIGGLFTRKYGRVTSCFSSSNGILGIDSGSSSATSSPDGTTPCVTVAPQPGDNFACAANRLASPQRRRALLADGAYLVGGGAMLASTFLNWVSRGPGSAARRHKLVDEIVALGKHWLALSSGRLTVLWYLVPALGAADGSWSVCAARTVGPRASSRSSPS